jgi:hypothetical protein
MFLIAYSTIPFENEKKSYFSTAKQNEKEPKKQP